MITMKVGSGAKAPVRFVFSDDVSETTVTLQGDDDSATVVAKLQRVLELEGASARPSAEALEEWRRQAILAQMPEIPEFVKEPLFDATGAEEAAKKQPVGWEKLAADGGEDLPVMD
ncbi:MAG: hypothetical protein ACTHON_18245 [Humibacter sp.]